MREREVEKYLREEVTKRGGLCYKFVSPGNAGVPDRIIVFDRQVIFIETKQPEGKTAALQDYQMKELLKRKAEVYVAHTKAQVDDIISGVFGK